MKRIVITGATGAIGRALIKICIETGYEVLAVVHRNSSRASDLYDIDHCEVLQLDLNEYSKAMTEIETQGIDAEGCEIFMHLAWAAPFGEGRNDLGLQLNNVRYALDAVRFASELGCSTFIGTGSQAEYGRVEGVLSPETPAFPETGYGIAKLCAGQMTRLECDKLNMKHIWTRVLSVYGPYDGEHTLISIAINSMLNNDDTEFTMCEQMWDYIYSDDAARAILLAGEKAKNGEVFVIGSGDAKPLKEYIKTISVITGYTKEIGFGKREYNDKQVMHLQADTAKLTAIGFEPKVSFEDGIKIICEKKLSVK